MSKMGSEFIREADDRADRDADEAAWLRAEVTRLEGIIERAALLLDEGDPRKVLGELGEDLRDARLDGDARIVAELAVTIARVRALLES